LYRVSNVFDLKELTNIRMVNIQISSKCSAPHTALRDGVHGRIKKLHETYRSTTFTIIGNRTATLAKFAKIAGRPPANFGLHDYFAKFMGDAFNIIRYIHIETRDR